MSFEDYLVKNIDYNTKRNPESNLMDNEVLLTELLSKREKFLKDNRPNEMDFIDIYSEEKIKKDLNDVSFLKGKWQKKLDEKEPKEQYLRKISSIFEILLVEQIEQNNWLGNNSETFVASETDDLKNKIDFGVFFNVENNEEVSRHLGFSTDVVFSSDMEYVSNKLDSIKSCIDSGLLPTLEYFEDPITGEHKKIFLPKVVVGSSLSSAERLIKIWGSHDSHKNKILAEDPIQAQIVLESIYQLKYFYNYAKDLYIKNKGDSEKSQKYLEIAKSYGEMNNIFCEIYEEKKKIINTYFDSSNNKDLVYQKICQYTGNIV